MPMWPFGRRRRNTEGPQPVAESKPIGDDVRPGTPKSQGVARKNSRRQSRRKRRKSSPHKSPRPSGENKENERPGNADDNSHDNDDSASQRSFSAERPSGGLKPSTLPMRSVPTSSPHLRPITLRETPYNFSLENNADSAMSLPNARDRGKLQRPQSLRRPESLVPRRNTTKKRKPDPVREEEIKAMSAPVPIKRPATYSGSMLRRDTKKMRGGLNRNFERPTSDVSLPMQDSIHSSMSGSLDLKGFKVSSFDVFSARPKLRYSASVQMDSAAMRRASPPPTRGESRKGKRVASPRESIEMSRIGELADDMDASSLRDIMEREERRRARKKEREEEKLRRKLERRAEKQRAKEARAREPRRDPETGTFQRRGGASNESVPPSPAPTIPPKNERRETQDLTMRDLSPADKYYEPAEQHHDSAVVADLSPPEMPSPSPLQTPTEEAVIGTAQAVRYSRGSIQNSPPIQATHNRNISNISYLPDLISEAQPPASQPERVQTQPELKKRRSSETSGKRMGGWASILRKATFSRKRSSDQGVRAIPSEVSFSNTSRESMSRQPLPAHLVQPPPPPPRSAARASGAPVRTMSKFREDLPELPMSPPASRVQSPEALEMAPPVPPLSTRRGLRAPAKIETEPPRQQATPEPEPEEMASDEMLDSPSQRTSGLKSLKSMSMASVDSEGSWLSGRAYKRSSAQRYRGSISSKQPEESNEDVFETANESSEEHDVHDDEYFRQLSPTPDRRMSTASDAFNRKPSSTILGPSAAAEEARSQMPPGPEPLSGRPLSGDEVLHTGVARTPTVVTRPSAVRVKSSEGLVNLIEGSDTARSSHSDYHGMAVDEPEEEHAEAQAFMLERAKSIDLGRRQHGRHVSAGSAKLLNIKRASTNPSVPNSPLPPSDAA